MSGRIGMGAELALRSCAAPLVLGLRWATRGWHHGSAGIPTPRLGLGLLAKIALDEFFLATELISATVVSLTDHRRSTREISEALELYAARGWLDAPERYHREPPPPDRVAVDWFGSLWGAYAHLRFESGYAPHPEEPGRSRWLAYLPNRTAHAWLLEHPGAPRPWLICVPGYRMGHPAVDFTGFRARWLHRALGLNLAIPVLPFHGPRSVGRRGGDGFLSGDFLDTVHAQSQAVWDTRRLVGWLRAQGAPGVGLYGVSLGGYTTALIASLEQELDCVIAGIPAADLVHLMRGHLPPFVTSAAERLGFPFQHIEQLLTVVSPLALTPRVPRERRYLYAGIADRLATPEHARALWQHWGRPRLAWYEGGHVSFLWEQKVQALLREALGSCGLLPREPRVELPD